MVLHKDTFCNKSSNFKNAAFKNVYKIFLHYCYLFFNLGLALLSTNFFVQYKNNKMKDKLIATDF